jgi:DNA-binding transcriptional LysR family regulator
LAEISISKQVAMLAVKNPKLVFEFYSLRSAEVVEQVASGLLDFGICFAPTPSPSIKIQQIKKERLMISVKKHHPLKNLKGIKLVNAFADFPFISPKAFAGIEVCEDHPALLKLGVPMNPTFIYDSYDTACSAILNGFYWGLIPECFVKKYSLTSLDVPNFEAHTHLSAVFSKRRTLPKSIQNWIKTISF